MIKKRIIPFSWLPASWGLAGPAREEAKAYYELDGYELEVRLAEIHLSGNLLKTRLAQLGKQYGTLSEYDYEVEVTSMIVDPIDRKIALLEIDIQHGNIPENEGMKEIATLKGESWIKISNDGFNKEQGINGYFFEFEWNDFWIDELRDAGYIGTTDEALIEAWFQDVCRQEASASMGAPPINGGVVRG